MNITYLLGAGASYNAVPLVKEFNPSFDRFCRNLRDKTFLESKGIPIDETFIEKIDSQLDTVLSDLDRMHSVDTLARKYYLIHEMDKLHWLKTMVSLFFIYLQLSPKHSMSEGISSSKRISHTGLVDKRYTQFFARYISKNKGLRDYSENVRILSWNYDLQVELAHAEFSDSFGRGDSFGSSDGFTFFPWIDGTGSSMMQNEEFPRLLHLNGTTGVFWTDDETYKDKIHSPPGSVRGNQMEDWRTFFGRVIEWASDKMPWSGDQWRSDSLMRFSWENDPMTNKIREYAKQIAKRTDVLVVIGYSFPIFNRDVDSDIITEMVLPNESENRLKRIVIQNNSNFDLSRVEFLLERAFDTDRARNSALKESYRVHNSSRRPKSSWFGFLKAEGIWPKVELKADLEEFYYP